MKKMGIQTSLATSQEYSVDGGEFKPYNPALTLGGLEVGVTPLEMSHAYLTLARDGERVSGTLASAGDGPLAISQVKDSAEGDPVETNDGKDGQNEIQTERVLAEETATTEKSVLETVRLRRHRRPRRLRRLRLGQDRHHREQRRRLVLRGHARTSPPASGSATPRATRRWRPSTPAPPSTAAPIPP